MNEILNELKEIKKLLQVIVSNQEQGNTLNAVEVIQSMRNLEVRPLNAESLNVKGKVVITE